MKILRKARVREVKRISVTGHSTWTQKVEKCISTKSIAKKIIRKLQKSQWKALILYRDIARLKRLKAYGTSEWYLGEVTSSEVFVRGISRKLPLFWTNYSLSNTTNKMRDTLLKNSKLLTGQTQQSIPNMSETNIDILQSKEYLLPIPTYIGFSKKKCSIH